MIPLQHKTFYICYLVVSEIENISLTSAPAVGCIAVLFLEKCVSPSWVKLGDMSLVSTEY